MAKLTPGSKLPDFTFRTISEKDLKISEAAKAAGKTALVFLRYYGCPFCQLDMHDYAERFEDITANGGQFYVVLQSDPEKLSAALDGKSLPYPVICDPGQELYKLLEIPAAASMENMMGPKAPAKIERVNAGGYQHGDFEGEELQLPATFVIDPDLNVLYARYAAEAADSATAEELIRILD